MNSRTSHWEQVYLTKATTEVSWFQTEPTLSMELIHQFCPTRAGVIDIGGGASVLVDRLLERGYSDLTVLDVSEAALGQSNARLGDAAAQVQWIVADVAAVEQVGHYNVWHDRAAFHFLTERADRIRYRDLALRSLAPGGHLILATFAPDGPTRCSNLDVCRYDGATAQRELGDHFTLILERHENHLTPWGKPQSFFYGVFQRRG